MIIVGLTGGIGAGKSTVARMLQAMGFAVYVADREASRLMEEHEGIRRDIIARFGEKTYADGKLHKEMLRGVVFDDRQALANLNRIVHPRVMEDFAAWCGRQRGEMAFFESAILYELGLDKHFNRVVCVTAPVEVRMARVMRRDGTGRKQVESRMRNQAEEEEKCRRADYVICNDGRQMVTRQVLDMVKVIYHLPFSNFN